MQFILTVNATIPTFSLYTIFLNFWRIAI